MEVTLRSSQGVPDDAIISIRSGAVRRQGAVSSGRPFRFPKGTSETDCVVKIDIMKNIGSGYLVLRPNEQEGKQYQVVMGDNPDMTCDVEVKPLEGDARALPEPEAPAAEAKTAKEYMDSKGLLQFVQGVLQVVVKQQPDDPYAAMAKHFLSGQSADGPRAAPAVETGGVTAPASPKAEASPADVPAEAAAVPSAPASPKAEEAGAPAAEQTAAEAGSPKAAPADTAADAAPASPKNEATAEEGGEKATAPDAGADQAEPAHSDVEEDNKSDAMEKVTALAATGDMSAALQGNEAAGAEGKEGDKSEQPEAETKPEETAAAPVTDSPAADAPTTDAPAAEAPADAAAVDSPAAAAPATDAPAADAPATDAPAADAPATDATKEESAAPATE